MKPKMNDKISPNKKTVTVGVLALAVVALLAGASVSASLEEFAAPVYAEEDPYNGAVDDITGDANWDEIKTDDKQFEKGLKNWIHKGMKDRMEDRMEDREEHLEKRISLDNKVLSAIEFCLSQINCSADYNILNSTVLEISERVMKMQASLDGTEISKSEEFVDKDVKNLLSSDCESDSEEHCHVEMNEELCLEKGGLWTNASDRWEGKLHCDLKQAFESESNKKLASIEAVKTAISFCIDSSDCESDFEELAMILTHMEQRENHEKDCKNNNRCHRDKDERKGFFDRIRGMLGLDEDEETREYSTRSTDYRTDVKLEETTQEDCELKGGIWDEEKLQCFKDCNKDDDREESESDEQTEERDEQQTSSDSETNRER